MVRPEVMNRNRIGCNNCKTEWETDFHDSLSPIKPCEKCGVASFYKVIYSGKDEEQQGNPDEKTTRNIQKE